MTQKNVLQIVYYDGQFNDTRMALAVACTAREKGATVLNHTEVIELIHDENTGQAIGAKIRDTLTGKVVDAYAKVIINATGPFTDDIRFVTVCCIEIDS